ncbi:MAG: thrombospondin type-1 domain-containing protein [Promethearchaeia archaeon]
MLSATTTGTANITRAVTCVNAVSNQPASLAKCQALAGPRPDDIRLVTGTKRCGFDFSAGEWLPCSTACGSGVENRVVTCKRSDGATVSSHICRERGLEVSPSSTRNS